MKNWVFLLYRLLAENKQRSNFFFKFMLRYLSKWYLIRWWSSHWRCSVKKGVLRTFVKFTGKHLCQSLFFNKVAGLRPCLRKRLLKTAQKIPPTFHITDRNHKECNKKIKMSWQKIDLYLQKIVCHLFKPTEHLAKLYCCI